MCNYPSVSITLPPDVLKRFSALASNFIETGTFDGRTVAMALDCGMAKIYSVELDPKYFTISFDRFANNPNVKLYMGDSTIMLPNILNDLNGEKAIIWLDAHIQEGVAGELKVPLLKELEILSNADRKDHVLLIDDRRLMVTSMSWWEHILETKVIDAILKINYKYNIEYINSNAAERDIIAAFL